MKKILLIGALQSFQRDFSGFTHYADGIVKTFGDDYRIDITYIDEIVASLRQVEFMLFDAITDNKLTDYNLIILHGKIRQNPEIPYIVSRFCAHHGIEIINEYSYYNPGSKVAQAITFFEEGAPFVPTVFCLNVQSLLRYTERLFTYPIVIKAINGYKGKSNYLVKNYDEAQKVFESEPDVEFLAQEYCPNDCDYRFLISPVTDAHLLIRRMAADGSHLNNTSQGGSAELVSGVLPEDIVKHSYAIAKRLGLRVAGVDVMQNRDTKEYVFIEINSQPQTFTGTFLEEKRAFITEVARILSE